MKYIILDIYNNVILQTDNKQEFIKKCDMLDNQNRVYKTIIK